MIPKAKLKLIRSLERKKYRTDNNLFVVEGPKSVADMMTAFSCKYIAATKEWIDGNQDIVKNILCDELNQEELRKTSFQEHPQQVIALFELPEYNIEDINPQKQLILALDDIQNPGNLGTIIRIADWFGINDIVCSEATADAFSPKTVQAAMGSLARVRVHYINLKQWLKCIKKNVPVYGTFLNGDNIYETNLTDNGIIVMGNEGNGISPEIEQLVNHRITIPNRNTAATHADSLNVAIATAITCSEFRRR